MKFKKELLNISIISLIALLIDQITKLLVVNNIDLFDSIHIIKNFFRISYVQNTGAAWSIFSNSQMFLIITTLTILILFIYFLLKLDKIKNSEQIVYGILIGGILGNLIDRIRLGYVIDFLDFNFSSFNFPVFNLADTFIVISGIILIIKLMKEEKKDV